MAVPTPLRQQFTYLAPSDDVRVVPGQRVRVPFGRRHVIGVVLAVDVDSNLPFARMRRIDKVLDTTPVFDSAQLALLRFTSEYFQHPVGEVVSAMLPAGLRHGRRANRVHPVGWRATPAGLTALAVGAVKGMRQLDVLTRLRPKDRVLTTQQLDVSQAVLNRLLKKGLIESVQIATTDNALQCASMQPLELNVQQRAAVDAILSARERFQAFLLEGVTGSGKTEVYLATIRAMLAEGAQALVLIPEIGLTPQTVRRFEQGLGVRVAAMHSGLSDGQRHDAWLRARDGSARVVVGTRSAIFAPLPDLGIVIVDEEHDVSFKQQDGVRYSARDLAVVRARDACVPVVLGSATPSLETLQNADARRYTSLTLTHRAAGAREPSVEVIDLRSRAVDGGLSAPMMEAVEQCLNDREQVILFVNRRGYAPVMLCRECGQIVDCTRCDAHMVLHHDDGRAHCHHCGYHCLQPTVCQCGGEMRALGVGTERVMEAIKRRFPGARVRRVDRDSTRRRGAMAELLAEVSARKVDVLVGTQMLAKGHHFPAVTLVGVLDGDAGLFSTDFRAAERLAQLLVQVSGRAGRAERAGRVLIQTHHPANPLLHTLVTQGYRAFAHEALAEREALGLPPFGHLALLRAEAMALSAAMEFLDAAKSCLQASDDVRLLGPIPSPMPRRAGRHRAQLLLEATRRNALQRLLRGWLDQVSQLSEARRVRWSLDVDPQDMG